MSDLNHTLYEVYFSNAEGVPTLSYVRASSVQEAKEYFLSKIDENYKIHYVAASNTEIYED